MARELYKSLETANIPIERWAKSIRQFMPKEMQMANKYEKIFLCNVITMKDHFWFIKL